MEELKKNWWKYLCILLLLYVHIAGLLVPLRPGIYAVEHTECIAGESCELQVKLYNAGLKAGDDVRVFLKFDSAFLVQAAEVSAPQDEYLEARVELPDYLPSDSKVITASLIVSSKSSGAMIIPSAVMLAQKDVNETRGKKLWSAVQNPGLKVKDGFYFPYRNILMETIRSLYYHVPMWFGMIVLFSYSAFLSLIVLRKERWELDYKIVHYNMIGLFFGVLGLLTGMIWAENAWGKFWSWDIKQTTSAITLFLYCAYFFLRNGIRDEVQKVRVGNAFNLFCFALLIPLLFIVPRMMDSLHPGNGGNPALAQEDLDNTMRMVFYPAVIGYILLGFWLAQIMNRIKILEK